MKSFLFMSLAFCIITTISSCSQSKKTTDIEVKKYIVLYKDGYSPKDEDFAPSYILKDAIRVNKTKNEWMITLQKGEKSLTEATDYIKNLTYVVKVSTRGTPKSATTSQKKSKTNINN